MDERELDKKLNHLELPDIETADHRRRLRLALLQAEYEEVGWWRNTRLRLSVWMQSRLDEIAALAAPRSLGWQFAAAAVTTLAVLVSLVLPPLMGYLNQIPADSGSSYVKIDDWVPDKTTTPSVTMTTTTTTPYATMTTTTTQTLVTTTKSVTTMAGGVVTAPASMPPPAVLPGPTTFGSIGLAAGGAMDIENFRQNIANGYLPLPTDMTYEGLFYDYYFDTGQAEACDQLFCPSYTCAVTQDPLSGETEYYLSVGLNSGLQESDFERKSLNLVVVLDISGSMSDPFNSYYYDSYGDKVELSDEEKEMAKIEVAKESLLAMLEHLGDDDRLGIVLFNSDAQLAKPLNLVGETDMDALEEHIMDIQADGSTNIYAGLDMASDLFEGLLDADQSEYENRIIILSDAMPNTGYIDESDFQQKMTQNAEDNLYTTFIGIGVDFNTELAECMTDTRGANYYSVHSPEQFRERMDDEFEYMVTPLVFDLQLTLEADGWEIEKVYGSPQADEATGELMKVSTLFPSATEDGETRGGIVLLKLKKTAEDSSLNLSVSYEDREGNLESSEKSIDFADEEPEYFANSGIRKGVLLARYADLVKNWLIDQREHAEEDEWESRINHEDGIIVPPPAPTEWERQSLPLAVSADYQQIFQQFADYFRAEAQAIGDEELEQELEILDLLSGWEED